eukprot:COSAG05_NODE_9937_length_592_cov_1.947262_1_plen_60_part_01
MYMYSATKHKTEAIPQLKNQNIAALASIYPIAWCKYRSTGTIVPVLSSSNYVVSGSTPQK